MLVAWSWGSEDGLGADKDDKVEDYVDSVVWGLDWRRLLLCLDRQWKEGKRERKNGIGNGDRDINRENKKK